MNKNSLFHFFINCYLQLEFNPFNVCDFLAENLLNRKT